MIADKWTEKTFKKLLEKSFKKIGIGIPYLTQQKIINNATKFYVFVTKIFFALFLIYFFNTVVLNRAGFENTIIILLVIMVLRLRK